MEVVTTVKMCNIITINKPTPSFYRLNDLDVLPVVQLTESDHSRKISHSTDLLTPILHGVF